MHMHMSARCLIHVPIDVVLHSTLLQICECRQPRATSSPFTRASRANLCSSRSASKFGRRLFAAGEALIRGHPRPAARRRLPENPRPLHRRPRVGKRHWRILRTPCPGLCRHDDPLHEPRLLSTCLTSWCLSAFTRVCG